MKYKIICKKCKGSRIVDIHDTEVGKRVDWLDDKQPEQFTIISMRTRFDGQLGWQCICGNNDMHTKQELTTIANQANPTPQEINTIMKNLMPEPTKFIMETI